MAKSELGVPKDLNGNGKIDDFEVEDALRDLERAEKHKENHKLMARVKKLAGRKVKALKGISSIQDLKDVYDEKYGSGAGERGALTDQDVARAKKK